MKSTKLMKRAPRWLNLVSTTILKSSHLSRHSSINAHHRLVIETRFQRLSNFRVISIVSLMAMSITVCECDNLKVMRTSSHNYCVTMYHPTT